MRWAIVKSATVVSNRVRIKFHGCKHTNERPLSDMIKVVNLDPQILVGKEYWCRECKPGVEEE